MRSVNEFFEQLMGLQMKKSAAYTMFHYTMENMQDRYVVDFCPAFKSEGWIQFDTDQDASYFGFWVNPSLRRELNFTEGEWKATQHLTAEGYNASVRHSMEYYGTTPAFVAIDIENKVQTNYMQDREECLAT